MHLRAARRHCAVFTQHPPCNAVIVFWKEKEQVAGMLGDLLTLHALHAHLKDLVLLARSLMGSSFLGHLTRRFLPGLGFLNMRSALTNSPLRSISSPMNAICTSSGSAAHPA